MKRWDERSPSHKSSTSQCVRKTRALNKRRKEKGLPPEPLVAPLLWIVAAAASAPMLRKIGAKAMDGWPTGIHFVGDDVFGVGIVVADELPRDRTTLLVRVMAAGPVLADAIATFARSSASRSAASPA